MRRQGIVKFFNDAKGFGFVVMSPENVDVFVHYSGIAKLGYKTLIEGQKVDFELVEGPKGLVAVDVKKAQ